MTLEVPPGLVHGALWRGEMDVDEPEAIRGKLLEYAGRVLPLWRSSPLIPAFLFRCMDTVTRAEFVALAFGDKRQAAHSSPRGDDDDKTTPDDGDIFALRRLRRGLQQEEDADELGDRVYRSLQRGALATVPAKLERFLGDWLRNEVAVCKQGTRPRDLNPALFELDNVLRYSPEELEVLCFFYCRSQSHALRFLSRHARPPDFMKMLSIATGLPRKSVSQLVNHNGRLRKTGVLVHNSEREQPFFYINEEVLDYLSGLDELPLVERYCKLDTEETYPLETFGVSPQQCELVLDLLKAGKPCSILLHGAAGTGKTEFARAVAAAAGKGAFFVRQGEKGSAEGRRLALQVTASCVAGAGNVVIVDEADSMLNSNVPFFVRESVEKGWLNDFLDSSRENIIWIVNGTSGMPPSLLRRFAYSVSFRGFTRQQRMNLWKTIAARHPLADSLPDELITALCTRYRVNAGGIASALDAAAAMSGGGKRDTAWLRRTLEELLARHQELTVGPASRREHPVTSTYDQTALNTDISADVILGSLSHFVRGGAWSPERGIRGVNLLFWGLPGTGKTEFAKFLADKLELELIVKRASTLLSCWLGETEKNIRNAFEEAEREKAVLFIDEADSFFIDRSAAQRSWEVTRTNELLTQMENHRGILICCTNLLDNLDRAAIRRFAWKVQFRPLKPEARLAVYRKYFSLPGKRLLQNHRERVRRIDGLTFGDFRAVAEKLRFQNPADLAHHGIIAALEVEAEYRNRGSQRKLGFR